MGDDVTRILESIERGHPRAADELLPLVYTELRQLAETRLADERPGQTLDATGLVHEAYLRLLGPAAEASFNSRGHFFAAAATAMRRILIDRARRRQANKRGGEFRRVEFSEGDVASRSPDDRLLALDEALGRLETIDTVKARLVELRFFSGMTNREAATQLGISTSTADRYWTYARAWLKREIDT